MKVEVFTLCWNEMAILPYAVKYWKNYASKVYVYDNGSTDGSLEYMAKFPELIEVRHFDTGNRKNNTTQMNLKNTVWKEARGRADLVVVCDLDEMLVTDADKLDTFFNAAGGTIAKPLWYDLLSDEVPHADEYLDFLRPYAVFNPSSKAVVFNPNAIDEINYTAGAHSCDPTGDVRWVGGSLYLLHANNSLSLEYKLERYRQQAARRSEEDIQKKHSIHYTFPEEKIRADWNEASKHVVDFHTISGW